MVDVSDVGNRLSKIKSEVQSKKDELLTLKVRREESELDLELKLSRLRELGFESVESAEQHIMEMTAKINVALDKVDDLLGKIGS